MIIPEVKEFTAFMVGERIFLSKEEAVQEAVKSALQETLDRCTYNDQGFDFERFEKKISNNKQFREIFLQYCQNIPL